jgi:sugar lactone lactonase YvrE
VVFAESAGCRVSKYWLTGDRAGTITPLVTELPGYPDNISTGSDGLLWVTIASPRDPLVELLQHRAPVAVRRAVTRVPQAMQPQPRRTARVQAYDDHGRLVHDVDADATSYHMVTGVREHHGSVWLGSLVEPAVAVVEAR